MSASPALLGSDDPVVLRLPSVLIALRLATMACRAAPRLPPQAACGLLLPNAPADAFANALARALPGLLLRRPVIRAPESRSRSFDEDWLVALGAALGRNDRDSVRFLTARRARPGGAEALHFLLGGLVARMDTS